LPASGGQGARLPAGPGLCAPRRRESARPRRAPAPGDSHLSGRRGGEGSRRGGAPHPRGGSGAMTPEEVTHEVRRLEITTRHLVRDIMAGEYSSAFRGRGVEFAEVREYQPGDDIRTIDWNVTARLGSAYVKRFLEERELTILFLADVRASVGFGTRLRTKHELGAEVTAVLAFAAARNNDRVGALFFTDRIEYHLAPAKGRRHVLRFISDLLAFT